MRLRSPFHPRAQTTTSLGASGPLSNAARQLVGWAIRETTGTTPAVIRIYDAPSASGPFVPIGLAAGASVREFPTSLMLKSGNLYYQLVSGAVEGTIFWA